MNANPALLIPVAKRLFWWLPPEEAIKNRTRFLAQVMALGTWEDIAVCKKVHPQERWKEALRAAPPGVIDPRSWHYWHHVFKMTPVPPLPVRKFLQE